MGSPVAMRKEVKSMILGSYDHPEEWFGCFVEQFVQFGLKMPPLWLYGCWLAHVIKFIFRQKHETLPTLTLLRNYKIFKEKNNVPQFSLQQFQTGGTNQALTG